MIRVQSLVVRRFLILFLFNISRIHATFAGNETDRVALLAFKHSIVRDPQMALSSWNDSLHFCRWEGVTCGRQHQRVSILKFESKGLAGPLSPYVGNLSFLRLLNISNNSFYGEIPHQLGRLFRLKKLHMNFNNFEGEIPANISHCSNLTLLVVANNNLVGTLPVELTALSTLEILAVHRNRLRGLIPNFLGNLTSLERISAGGNKFRGSIPDSIGQLKNLAFIGLGGNNLSGTIPSSVYNLSMLTLLSLDANQFQGSLPPYIGLRLPHLQTLKLSDNLFTGSLPYSLSNCSYLEVLHISLNNFDGKIVIDFGRIKNIMEINVHSNNFGSGELDELNFIASAANCSNLQLIELGDNKLSGSLPNSMSNLSSKVHYIDLGENLIYGTLPSTIGKLVGLTTFFLFDNQFTGTIPSSIGNLQKLKKLAFEKNKFSGTLPDAIGNLSLLLELGIEMNELEGTIPISLGNCRSLLDLDLSQNNLRGLVPKQLFRLSTLSESLNFSGNQLHGSLPLEIGNLKNLGSLDFSKNDLSGNIPSSLGGCTSLENIFLQQNFFQGSLPPSLSSLKGVINLDLSHNNLSGQIPRYFEQFAMNYLDLSFNNFEGEVPLRGVFTNQSAIHIVGNNKLCGGVPELHLRKCSSNRQQGVSRALIIVISIISSLVCSITLVLCYLFCWHKRTRKEKSSEPLLNEPFLRVSYEKLLKATDGFSLDNLVGRGSCGSVYKGILDVNEAVVAVKVLNLQSRGASKSFMNECEALRNVRHRNLVKIITSCSGVDFHGNDFKALVYEFMPNGSLEDWMHSSKEVKNEQGGLKILSLLQRTNIAIDVACALDYLHHHCENRIIHCDLKPSNILLDKDMVAHIGDFGLAKLLPDMIDAIQSGSTEIRGTIGYTAPEYGTGSEISAMGDVYSYGILLLEMMTGKRPTDSMFDEGLNLHNFAKMFLHDRVIEILDPILVKDIGQKKVECLISAIKIGVGCSVESPQDRMDISKVLLELRSIRRVLQGA